MFFAVSGIPERFVRKILWPHLHNNWIGAIRESFLREILVLCRNAEVLSLENVPLYGVYNYMYADGVCKVVLLDSSAPMY